MKPESHEYADMFPMLDGQDLQSLADDIKRNGQNEPIIIYDGKILDGRNRYAACELSGVDPATREYQGADPLAFVLSQNLHRRHLTTTQRAMMAEKVATIRSGENQYSEGLSQDKPSPDRKTRQQAAKELDVSEPSLDRARFVRKHGAPELIESVESGNLTITTAARIAKLDHDEQLKAVSDPTLAPKPKPKPAKAEQPNEDAELPKPRVSITPEGKLSALASEASSILRNMSIPSRDADIEKVKTIITKISKL